jgi:hypothetical protein
LHYRQPAPALRTENAMVFREEQKFHQRWLWLMLLALTLATVIFFGKGMVQQLVLGKPWGDRPMSDPALLFVGSGTILFVLAMTYLFYCLKLITEVRDNGLYVQFFPLRKRKIDFRDIQSCEVRTYNPIHDYGGWGIKSGRKGKAYNVSGDRGVMLAFFDGQPLLIGSQRAEELAAAIRRHLRH